MRGTPPLPVFAALLGSYALAAVLLLSGLLGLLTWAALGERVGVGATIFGLLVLGTTYIAWRGSNAGRALLGLLGAICAVAGVICMFALPGEAFITSLVVALLGAGMVFLLFFPERSKRFYAAA